MLADPKNNKYVKMLSESGEICFVLGQKGKHTLIKLDSGEKLLIHPDELEPLCNGCCYVEDRLKNPDGCEGCIATDENGLFI